MQLVNAFRVAQKFRADTLQFAKAHPFLDGARSGPFAIEVSRSSDALTLESRFFSLKALRLKRVASRKVAEVIADLVRPILSDSIREPDPRVGPDDLVLHFRGGDIFGPPNPESRVHAYGQPPLSYYLAAVEREKPSRVWLVCEDDSNPCIQAVAAALTNSALARHPREINIRRFGNLTDDIRLLMSARRLVAGRGSFAYMIAHLSNRLQKGYFFEAKRYFGGPRTLPTLTELGVEMVDARDADGEYRANLLEGNWTNSHEQREMMLTYPADKLSFTVHPGKPL